MHETEMRQRVGCTRAELLEQVMRLTGDDLLVLPFTTCEPGSAEFLSAAGRLLSDGPHPMVTGSPLHRWAHREPTAARESWRDDVLPSAMSLWGELVMLRSLHEPATESGSPLDQLTELRRHGL